MIVHPPALRTCWFLENTAEGPLVYQLTGAREQYLPGVRQWGLDASLFKTVPINERLRLRLTW